MSNDKITVHLRGTAICKFVRIMEVYPDEVEELLNNEELIEEKLDSPRTAIDIQEWTDASATRIVSSNETKNRG